MLTLCIANLCSINLKIFIIDPLSRHFSPSQLYHFPCHFPVEKLLPVFILKFQLSPFYPPPSPSVEMGVVCAFFYDKI